MRENWKQAAFGVFFWVAMGLLFLQTIVFPRNGERLKRVYMPLVFGSAQGLHEGTRVTVLGVDQGAIMHLAYLPIDDAGSVVGWNDGHAEGQAVLAIVRLNSAVQIYPNYRVRTLHAGVITEKIVDIDPGRGNQSSLLSPRYLSSAEVYAFLKSGEIRLRAGEAIEGRNFDDPLTIVADVLYENRENIRRVFKNSRQITDSINTGKGSVALLLNDDRLHRGLNDVLKDSHLLVGQGGELLETLRENRAFIELIGVIPSILSSVMVH